MRHRLEWTDVWRSAAAIWDDEAGTLEFVSDPAELTPFTRELMQRLVDVVDEARERGRTVIQWAPEPHRYVLEDPAHNAADFLRLIVEYGAGSPGNGLRLPDSLRDVEMTPAEELELPLGVVA